MDINTIIKLVEAGYTKDEIAQMQEPATPNPAPAPVDNPAPSGEPGPAPAPVVQPAAVPAPAAVAVPAPAPAPAPVPAQVQDQPSMADIMQGIAKLTSAVQANAIAQSIIPGVGNPAMTSAEDAIAEIIRPTMREVK